MRIRIVIETHDREIELELDGHSYTAPDAEELARALRDRTPIDISARGVLRSASGRNTLDFSTFDGAR